MGYNDSTGELYGVVSTGHTGSSPLPYQNFNTTVGPSANVGTLGYLWQPTGNGIIGGSATGSTMTFSGLYGPTGLNSFSSSPLSDMFSDGAQIVPLVQILLNGNLAIPDNYQNGNGTYISLGSSNFDLFGRPVGPYADLQLLFQQNVVISPEPGTWNLIVVAAICLIAGRRFRVR